MKLICPKCNSEVSYSKNDKIFELTNGICLACHLVLADHNYPKTENKTTVFSAFGGGLGDRTLFNVIKTQYLKDNPDENVIFLDETENHIEAINKYRPGKFFRNEFYRPELVGYHSPQLIYYILLNEVCAFAKQGIYPELEFPITKPDGAFPSEFIVCHFRNIEKFPGRPDPPRNVSTEYAEAIVELLKDYNLILVGNDRPVLSKKYKNVWDFREVLTLGEIAWLCQNSLLYLGKDSGIMHVAAAAGAKIMAWGFDGIKWHPKTGKKCYLLQKSESNLENILNGIRVTL